MFDIGANIGSYALANYKNDSVKIVCAEASPITFNKLKDATIQRLHFISESKSTNCMF